MNNRRAYSYIFNKLLMIFIAVLYFLSVSFLPFDYFRDRDVYLSFYALHSDFIFNSFNGIALFSNEPLFLQINMVLSNYLSPYYVVESFVCFVIFSIMFFLVKESKNLICFLFGLILLFFCNYLFHLQFVVLRQAIATIICVYAILIFESNYKILLLFFIASFIHSSFFLYTILFIIYMMSLRINYEKAGYLISFAFSLVLSASIFVVGKFLGVRQVDESGGDGGLSVGGGAFLLYSMVLIYLLFFFEVKKDKLYHLAIIFLINYLTMYFLTPIAGRLMSTNFLIVLLLIIRNDKIYNYFFLIILSVIFIILAFNGNIESMSLNVTFDTLINSINPFKGLL